MSCRNPFSNQVNSLNGERAMVECHIRACRNPFSNQVNSLTKEVRMQDVT